MPEFLRIATAIVALAVAAVSIVAAVRDRPPTRLALVGVVVLEAFVLALIGTAVASIIAGHRAPEMITFVGYLIAFAIISPAGFALARMEPTKWGSVIIAAVGIVEAILVVRLQQVWTGI